MNKSAEIIKNILKRIFTIDSYSRFESVALDIFNFQYNNNPVYKAYVDYLHVDRSKIRSLQSIPFLPIEFFKTQKIVTTEFSEDIIFTSSGTTGQQISKHFVADLKIYEESFMQAFIFFYNSVQDYTFLALLPSYMERQGSSLIYMMEKLFEHSGSLANGFYLNEYEKLYTQLLHLNNLGKKTILVGVSYALLDFAEKYSAKLENVIFLETGGMKGMKQEITKEEMYEKIKASFPGIQIHSEYGMTELLSQAYSLGEAKYNTPPWMKVFIRDMYDPFEYVAEGKKGGINIIDLANIYSCSFIETKDVGSITANGFSIHGRIDNADIRGCNLMLSS